MKLILQNLTSNGWHYLFFILFFLFIECMQPKVMAII